MLFLKKNKTISSERCRLWSIHSYTQTGLILLLLFKLKFPLLCRIDQCALENGRALEEFQFGTYTHRCVQEIEPWEIVSVLSPRVQRLLSWTNIFLLYKPNPIPCADARARIISRWVHLVSGAAPLLHVWSVPFLMKKSIVYCTGKSE